MTWICVAVLAQALLPRAAATYPGPDWPVAVSPERHGSSAQRREEYDKWIRSQAGDYWASVVVQGGYLLYAGRGPRCHIRQENDCGSIKKSLQSTVLGAALLQGKLKSLDEDALQYWQDPFLTPHQNDRKISFRLFASYRDRWLEPEEPGTFRYNNASATAAGAAVAGLFQVVRGKRPRGIAEVAEREVMRRIGARWNLWYWDQDFGDNPGNPGPRLVLEASVYELAKLGYLWLRKGKWNDQRIFSEDYYREATTDWSPNTGSSEFGRVGHYGYWWFVNARRILLPDLPEDAFYHIGNGSPKRATMLLVIPSHDTVAVLSMERLSDEKKWDVIAGSRSPGNEGPRAWAKQVGLLRLQ
jgi:CubicO group peptidase (beta-lactamase class C family)